MRKFDESFDDTHPCSASAVLSRSHCLTSDWASQHTLRHSNSSFQRDCRGSRSGTVTVARHGSGFKSPATSARSEPETALASVSCHGLGPRARWLALALMPVRRPGPKPARRYSVRPPRLLRLSRASQRPAGPPGPPMRSNDHGDGGPGLDLQPELHAAVVPRPPGLAFSEVTVPVV